MSDSRNVAGDSRNVAGDSRNVAGNSRNVAGDSRNVADDSRNVVGHRFGFGLRNDNEHVAKCQLSRALVQAKATATTRSSEQ